jgi:hypothetical protein
VALHAHEVAPHVALRETYYALTNTVTQRSIRDGDLLVAPPTDRDLIGEIYTYNHSLPTRVLRDYAQAGPIRAKNKKNYAKEVRKGVNTYKSKKSRRKARLSHAKRVLTLPIPDAIVYVLDE